jgi:hypothetical protein
VLNRLGGGREHAPAARHARGACLDALLGPALPISLSVRSTHAHPRLLLDGRVAVLSPWNWPLLLHLFYKHLVPTSSPNSRRRWFAPPSVQNESTPRDTDSELWFAARPSHPF